MRILLFSCLLLTSCWSLKPVSENENRLHLTENDLAMFNGEYEIFSVDTSYRTSEYALLNKDFFNFENRPDSSDYLQLEIVDKRHIKVTVVNDGTVIRSKILKGVLEGDYFEFKSVTTFPLYYVILNGYSTQKTRIGILKNGNLTMDTQGGGCALLVLFPIICAGSEEYGLEFKRK